VALLALPAFGAQQSSGASPGIRNGRIAYDHVGNGSRLQIYTVTATTDPARSPSGQEIAFSVGSPAAQNGIWVVGVDGRGLRRLTTGRDVSPSWPSTARTDPSTAPRARSST
jgi:hypothetical protein